LRQARVPHAVELEVHGDGKPEAAIAAMRKLLALPDPPTAVFCYNDMSALGALSAIRQHGLRVPEDISLVGFDDLFLASYTHPRLTTVRQPMRRMGMLAIESLLNLMSGLDSTNSVKVPAELIVRESTGPVRKKESK